MASSASSPSSARANVAAAFRRASGFAETARYQRLRPENFPSDYEQVLWGVYDVPDYVRNLFIRPVIAYSGELDKQIQAARVMEEAFQGSLKIKNAIRCAINKICGSI